MGSSPGFRNSSAALDAFGSRAQGLAFQNEAADHRGHRGESQHADRDGPGRLKKEHAARRRRRWRFPSCAAWPAWTLRSRHGLRGLGSGGVSVMIAPLTSGNRFGRRGKGFITVRHGSDAEMRFSRWAVCSYRLCHVRPSARDSTPFPSRPDSDRLPRHGSGGPLLWAAAGRRGDDRGVFLGPSLLGLFWPGSGAQLFPPDSMKVLYPDRPVRPGDLHVCRRAGVPRGHRRPETAQRGRRVRGRDGRAVRSRGGCWPFTSSITRRFSASGPPSAGGVFLGASMCITAFPMLARIISFTRARRARPWARWPSAPGRSMTRPLGACWPWCWPASTATSATPYRTSAAARPMSATVFSS